MEGNSDVSRALAQRNFDEVVRLLNEIGKERALTSAELVLLGRSIQVSEHGELADARIAFERAIALDESNVGPQLELGWFLYSVENEVGAARPFFERALDKARSQMRESIEGLLHCIVELEGKTAAQKALEILVRELIDKRQFLRKLDGQTDTSVSE